MCSPLPRPDRLFRAIGRRWHAPGGYREFLSIALPLILSTASWSLQNFTDRVFLSWYSTEALAAAMPAGMCSFLIVSFFMGIAGYANTFVAQYVGARRPHRVGPAIWQGVYLSLVGAAVGLMAAAWARPLFDLVGHDPAVRRNEVDYFRILCYGTGPQVVATAVSCFYSGRGKTWVLLLVNLLAITFNIILDYGLIFGSFGLPELGISGAAWATDLALTFTAICYLLLFLLPHHQKAFATLRGWRFDAGLFRRLLIYGGPSGLNFLLDMTAFTLFMLIIGRLGTIELAATNLAFNINHLAFMPIIGCGTAVSTMVGQRLGRDDPLAAEYCTWSGFHLATGYMAIMSLGYVLLPDVFLAPFAMHSQSAEFELSRRMATQLLRIVAVYCLFDAFYIIFTSALRGAGDTRYIMWVSVLMAWCIMVVPSMLSLRYLDSGIYVLWSYLCAYIIVAGLVFYRRFRIGNWKTMRVIERRPLRNAADGPPE